MAPLLTDRETIGQMDECNPPSLRFCPFLNIPDSSKRKNPECFYTRTIKAVYSILLFCRAVVDKKFLSI